MSKRKIYGISLLDRSQVIKEELEHRIIKERINHYRRRYENGYIDVHEFKKIVNEYKKQLHKNRG